jgi:hypothetical protein
MTALPPNSPPSELTNKLVEKAEADRRVIYRDSKEERSLTDELGTL